MVDYLNDFHRYYNLHIQFNTTIQNLKPISAQTMTCSSKACSFSVIPRFQMSDQDKNYYTCGLVFDALRIC